MALSLAESAARRAWCRTSLNKTPPACSFPAAVLGKPCNEETFSGPFGEFCLRIVLGKALGVEALDPLDRLNRGKSFTNHSSASSLNERRRNKRLGRRFGASSQLWASSELSGV